MRHSLHAGLMFGLLFGLTATDGLPADPEQPMPSPSWRWRHPGARDCEPPCPIRVSGLANATAHLVPGSAGQGRLSVEHRSSAGKTTWKVELAPQLGDTGALQMVDDRVFVAQHPGIASGCTLYALDAASGKQLWRTSLKALGPVDHSQYLNRVQLAFTRGVGLLVFGNEAGGKYLEVVDPKTGRSLTNQRLDDRWASIPWSWAATRRLLPYPSPISISADGGGRFEFTQTEKPERAALSKRSPKGKPQWTADLPFEFVGDAFLLEKEGTLFLTHYCAIASGTTVYAFDGQTGAQLWKTRPWGVGSIGHSKYANQVELRWMHDRLVVFGKESAGNYIEVLDPKTGLSLANQYFPYW